jgi:hypothetical protein
MSGMQSLGGLSDSPSQFSGKRFRSSLLKIGSIPDSRPRPEEIYSQLQQEQILALAIKQLKPGTPMAIQFRDLADRSVRETAQILGISAARVKRATVPRASEITRGVQALRGDGVQSPRREVEIESWQDWQVSLSARLQRARIRKRPTEVVMMTFLFAAVLAILAFLCIAGPGGDGR